MFVYRLAAGLVFLAGGAFSRAGLAMESWPLMAIGLLAATLGLWHFFMGGTAFRAAHERRRAAHGSRAEAPAADAATHRHS